MCNHMTNWYFCIGSHMRKILFIIPLLLLSVFAKAQYYPNVTCVDTQYINIYYHCYDDYLPVCGCDGHTYRSLCAAYNWGGLLHAPTPYRDGPCTNFDFEFTPNPVVPGSNDKDNNGYGTLKIYTTLAPVTALIQIYDVFGKVWYVQVETIGQPQSVYIGPSIYMDGFPQGIYYVFVTINGEAMKKKIMKANLE